MTWRDYFAYDYAGAPFVLFGPGHLSVLAVLFVFGVFFLSFRGASAASRRRARLSLALLMAATEGSYHLWMFVIDRWTVQAMLPLHLCSALIWTAAYTLVTRNERTYEFVYLLGIGAALQALLTPEAAGYGIPHYRALETLAAHGLLIIAALYLTVVEGLRPMPRSIRRVVLGTLAYMVVVTGVNLAVGGNYMYTLGKPATASLLDAFGPWPWYLVPMIGVGILNCLLMYLPFWWDDRRRKSAAATLRDDSP
jgi:hypothetical integral membrane protein (TIGR02206 family)